jgi:CheY-like chemotaxis protein
MKVVEHLISNALKFTPKGGHVKVETKSLESGQAQVVVLDSGRGIPAEALPHLFQKFYHVDQSLTRPYGGMGLGLAFCKEVVQLHGGRVWIESKGVGQGALVSFVLPTTDQKPGESRAGDIKMPAAGQAAQAVKKNILWVDDNPNLLELVEYAFAGSAMAVNLQTALSGVSALAQVKNAKPDLLVLDIMMTDMDGLEVLDHLRSDPDTETLPVLIVSGYKEAAKTAMEHGADDYCLKPFRIQEIFKKVETLLNK